MKIGEFVGEEVLNKEFTRNENAISVGNSLLLKWMKDDWKKVKDILILLVGNRKDFLNLE